jgi:hypothetical protein
MARSLGSSVAGGLRRNLPAPPPASLVSLRLILLAAHLLAHTLTRKGGLRPALFPRFHVVTMLFDFLDDVRLLHPALESAQRALEGLTFLDNYFRQLENTSHPPQDLKDAEKGSSRETLHGAMSAPLVVRKRGPVKKFSHEVRISQRK